MPPSKFLLCISSSSFVSFSVFFVVDRIDEFPWTVAARVPLLNSEMNLNIFDNLSPEISVHCNPM